MSNVLEDFFTSSAQQKIEEAKYKKTGTGGMQVSSDQFLQLLVTQMSNQDPLAPMQDTEMMAQYAQLQQLDNQQTMTSAMTDMRKEYAIQGASSLIGKSVTATDSSGKTTTGVAVSIVYAKDDNNVEIKLDDGTSVNYGDITSVEAMATGANVNAASQMIGKFIIGIDENAKAYQGVVKNATTNGNAIFLETYDGVYVPLDGVAQVRDLTPSESAKLVEALDLVGKYVEAPQNGSSNPLTGVVKGIYSKDNQYWVETWGGTDIYVGNIMNRDAGGKVRELTTGELEDMELAKKYVGKFVKANDGKMTGGISEGFFYRDGAVGEDGKQAAGQFYIYTARGEVFAIDSLYYSRDYTAADQAQYGGTAGLSAELQTNLSKAVAEVLGTPFIGYDATGNEVAGVVDSVYLKNGLMMFGLVDQSVDAETGKTTIIRNEAVSPYSLYTNGGAAAA
ncbi:hypothetical protein FACS1894139_00350 [Planctomycetales bacterium]|nr:hypothetical protein FACS1894107_01220 [Planctomycetales bacterium]GHT02364.1 hypothetical protein FACS1894139_00350 [Planctomycetales bacterium]